MFLGRGARAVALLVVWFGALSHETRAQAVPGREEVLQRLDALAAVGDGIVRKWPGEVRYALIGRFDAAHVAGVRETIEAVRAATGLRVEDVTRDDRDPNLLFIFANNVDATVGDLALAARLIGPGETFVEYFARLRATLGRAGIFSSRRFEGGDIVSVAVVVNARLDNGDAALGARMAVAGFMDDTRLALDGIDAAVLAALYRTEVESGGRYADQRDALADATLRALTARAR